MPCLPPTLTVLIFLAATLPAYGQSQVYCPTAPEERERRCARVGAQIARDRGQIAFAEAQLRNPDVILARVEMQPQESLADYRARVERQQGVATPESNTWLPVLGRYFNPIRQRMYVALKRADYWRYIWESLAFDPDLAQADFKRRERRSRREKAFQLEAPESAINRLQYSLETQLAFQRECCEVPKASPPPPSVDFGPRPSAGSESR